MALDLHLSKKKRPANTRFQNRFFAHKCMPNEEIDRSMRRFETGYRCIGKHWIFSDEHEFYHR